MAAVRLEWSQFGDFDSFDVLRSNEPMDANALPTPIKEGLSSMYYADSAVVESATYYYRVVAIRGSERLVSAEIKVVAERDIHWDKVVSLLHFESSVSDEKGGVWSLFGGASISTSDKKFGAGSLLVLSANQYLLGPQMPALGLGDFCFEMFVKTSKNTSSITLFDNRYGGVSDGFSPQLSDGKKLGVYANGAWLVPAVSITLDLSDWVHIAFTRKSGLFRVFVGGLKKAEVTDNINYSAYRTMLGNNVNAISSHFLGGNIDEFRITSGEARYTADFTPPQKAFLAG